MRSRRARRGYLLVEAAVASAILAAVLGTTLNAVAQAQQALLDSQLRMEATRAAQMKQEQIRNTAYASISAVATAVVPHAPALRWGVAVQTQNGTVAAPGSGISPALNTPFEFKTVTVTVQYTVAGKTKNVTVSLNRMPST